MVLDAVLSRKPLQDVSQYSTQLSALSSQSAVPQLYQNHAATMSNLLQRQAETQAQMIDRSIDRGLQAWLQQQQLEHAKTQADRQHELAKRASDIEAEKFAFEKQFKPRELEAQIGQMEAARRLAELQAQQAQRTFDEEQRLARDLGLADALPNETIAQYQRRLGLKGTTAETRLKELQAEYMPKEFALKKQELEQQRALQSAQLALQRQQLAQQAQQFEFQKQQALQQQAQTELTNLATSVLSGQIQPPKGVQAHEYVMHVAQQRAKQLGLSNFDSMIMTTMALKQAGDEVGAKKAQAQMLAMSNPLEQARMQTAIKAFNTAVEGSEIFNRLSSAAARYTKAGRFWSPNDARDAAQEIRLLLGKLAQTNPELTVFVKRFEDIDAGVWGGDQKLANLFGAAPHIQLQELMRDLSAQIRGIVQSAPMTDFSSQYLQQANMLLDQSFARFKDASLSGTKPDNIFSQHVKGN